MLCLLGIAAGLAFAWTTPAQAIAEVAPVEQAPATLDAERFDFEGGVLVLDRQLLEHRDWIIPLLNEEIARAKMPTRFDQNAINTAAQQIVDTAYDMLGIAKEGDAYEQAIMSRTRSFIRNESPAFRFAEETTVYVLTRETIKAYLRARGTLPFCTYSQKDDRVDFSTGITWGQHNQLLPELLIPKGMTAQPGESFGPDWFRRILRTLYLYPKDTLPDMLFKDVAGLPQKNPDQAISSMSFYQAVSGVWLSLFKEQTQLYEDDHTAWFTNGITFALTEELLKQIEQERALGMLYHLKTGGGDPALGLPVQPSRSAYLRYRPRHLVFLATSRYHAKLESYRYAASILEAQELVKHITPNRLPELMQLLSQEQINTTAKLEAAINETFGYDIGARLDLYQPEQTVEEMHAQAINDFMQNRNAGEMTGAVINLIRAHEFQIGQAMGDQPKLYPPLYDMIVGVEGEREATAAVCNAWWDVMHRQTEPPSEMARISLAGRWLMVAMHERRPALASALIWALDEKPLVMPVDPQQRLGVQFYEQLAQLVRAHKLMKQGDPQAASELIEQANESFTDHPDFKYLRDEVFTPNVERLREQIRLAPTKRRG
ncbi:MAG: hypothetical protein AB8C95_05135 [Phycisphaeraceae bacterium]